MTDQTSNGNNLGLLILAGIGAGTLIGATIGLMLGHRTGHGSDTAILESVDELKEKAQHVLSQLSNNVAGLSGQDHPHQE